MAATVSTRITRLAAISPRTAAKNLQADLTIGDFRLGADYLRDAANSFGLASTVTAGDDVRFWAGQTFANRATAPARIYESGNFTFGTGTKTLVWDGSDLSLGGASLVAGTAASTVVSNAATGAAESGALALAGAKLAKAGGDILTGIIDVQQTTNYNAAIRTGDIAWNTTTGAITSGSGVAMTRLGLVGAAAGVTTFSINATTGAALFAGELSAPTGALGGFSLGADYVRDAANSFGMASTVTAGDDVRFWAGATFANRATAPLRLTESGILTAIGAQYGTAASGKRIDINITTANEMTFYGDRGDGTVEALATIGISADGADYVIGKFGSANSGNSRIGVLSDSYSGIAVVGRSVSSFGVVAQSTSGSGLMASSSSGFAAILYGNTTKAALCLVPQSGTPSATTEGQISFDSAAHALKYRDNSAWQTVANIGVATLSSLTSVGALDSGSITSGFGSIDVGADAISGGAISGSGAVTSSGATAGIGYATGAGGTVSQATSKSTGVTLNTVTGQITMYGTGAGGQLTAGQTAFMVVTDSAVAATDIVAVNHASGGSFGLYDLWAQAAAGSFTVAVKNISAGTLTEAIVIGFSVIKGVTS